MFDFDEAGPHPAVIVSHDARVSRKQHVNVLLCSSQRATRSPEATEVMLNSADGLDWETLCKCDHFYLVPKHRLYRQRGVVSQARQRQIMQTIWRSLGFMSH